LQIFLLLDASIVLWHKLGKSSHNQIMAFGLLLS